MIPEVRREAYRSGSDRVLPAMWLICLSAGTLIAVWWALRYPLNSDVGWWLHVSGLMLAGDRLYLDVLEVNPPLIGYLSMLPHALSSLLSLPITMSSKLISLAVVLAMIGWAVRLVRRSEDRQLAGIFAVALVVSLVGLVGFDLGQREHLMTALVLPLVAIKWLRIQGLPVEPRAARLSGLAAAIGFAIKPHFVVVWLMLEVFAALRTRRTRRKKIANLFQPETVTIGALLFVYWMLVLAQGDYLRFLTRTSGIYLAFAAKDRLGLAISFQSLFLAVGVLAVAVRSGPRVELARLLAVAGLGSWIVMLIQAKGWSYHLYPVVAFTMIAGLIVLYDFVLSTWRNPRQVTLLEGGIMSLVVALSMLTVKEWTKYHERFLTTKADEISQQATYLSQFGPRPSFAMFSDLVSDAFPMVIYSGAKWTSPFPAMWWLRAVYYSPTASAGESLHVKPGLEESEAFLIHALVTDFVSGSPRTVFVDTARHARYGYNAFPYIDYLSQDRAFRAAWRDYKPDGGLGHYAVWTRQDRDSDADLPTSMSDAP